MVHIMVKVHVLGRKVPEGLMLYTYQLCSKKYNCIRLKMVKLVLTCLQLLIYLI